MFNLIYFILGVCLIKAIIIRVNKELKKRNTIKASRKISIAKNIILKVKSYFHKKRSIFMKISKCEKDKIKNSKEQWNIIRHEALEKSSYKCEACGNIANLDVYMRDGREDDNEEAIVLCKKCYEKCMTEFKLHYN